MIGCGCVGLCWGLGLSKLRFISVLVHFPFEACCSVVGLVVLHCMLHMFSLCVGWMVSVHVVGCRCVGLALGLVFQSCG